MYIHPKEPLEVGRVGLLHAAHQADTGVVHQNIECREACERGLDGRFIGNIKYENGRAGQFPRQGFGSGLVDIGDGHLRAGRVERAAGGLADSAGSAGDQGLAPIHTKRKMHRLNSNALQVLQDEVVECRRCPRLIAHCREVARVKRRAYRDWEYWGKPVPSFGDLRAELLIVGLAPGAPGSNRTGRMFTGDMSGNILYRVLHQTGFASQPESVSREDGLRLIGAYITAVAHCAPPGNKPAREEIANCRPYLERELDLLKNVKVVVALGRVAFDNYLGILRGRGLIRSRAAFAFGHNRVFEIAPGQPMLISSYHPSQQNTSTGKLTEQMLAAVFRRARKIVAAKEDAKVARKAVRPERQD